MNMKNTKPVPGKYRLINKQGYFAASTDLNQKIYKDFFIGDVVLIDYVNFFNDGCISSNVSDDSFLVIDATDYDDKFTNEWQFFEKVDD